MAEFLPQPGPERAAVTGYALTFLAISICMRLAWRYASHERRLLSDDITSDDIATRNTTLMPVLAFYGVAVIFGILLPQVTVALIAVTVIFQAIPGPVLLPPAPSTQGEGMHRVSQPRGSPWRRVIVVGHIAEDAAMFGRLQGAAEAYCMS